MLRAIVFHVTFDQPMSNDVSGVPSDLTNGLDAAAGGNNTRWSKYDHMPAAVRVSLLVALS